MGNKSASGRKKRAVRPLRASPLFAPGVALWFAALFGLGSLAVSTPVLERIVLALHVEALIPAAAPPLGMTARILIASAMTLLGAAIGFAVAHVAAAPVRRRQAARARAATREPAGGAFEPEMPAFRARDLHPDAPVRAPVAALDEFGEPLLDEVVVPPPAPLAELVAMPVEETAPTEPAPEVAAVEPIGIAETPAGRAVPLAEAIALPEPEPEQEPEPEPEIAQPEPEAEPVAEAVPLPALSAAAQRIADADLDDLSNVELVERLAIAMRRRAAATSEESGDPVLVFPARGDRLVEPLTPTLRTLAEKRPEDTEKALRDALATLQRMSGAA